MYNITKITLAGALAFGLGAASLTATPAFARGGHTVGYTFSLSVRNADGQITQSPTVTAAEANAAIRQGAGNSVDGVWITEGTDPTRVVLTHRVTKKELRNQRRAARDAARGR